MNPTLFEHKIKLKYFLKTFEITLLILLGIAVYFLLDELHFTKLHYNSLLIVGIVSAGPSILLLIEYLYFSLKIRINIQGNDVTIFKNSLILNYKYSDIIHVTKFCSYPYSQGRKRIYISTDSFYFLKIKMTDGKEFIITSLMTDLKNTQFKIDKVEGRFIASIIFNS
jgi:hypothetical protein